MYDIRYYKYFVKELGRLFINSPEYRQTFFNFSLSLCLINVVSYELPVALKFPTLFKLMRP